MLNLSEQERIEIDIMVGYGDRMFTVTKTESFYRTRSDKDRLSKE